MSLHGHVWRKRHPEKRNIERKRYYEKHRVNSVNRRNAGQEWTLFEKKRITAVDRPPDPVLARELGRSVQAIQTQRFNMRQ